MVIVAAFAVGIGAGWGTSLFADNFNSPTPSLSPSVSPSPSVTPNPDVSLPPMDPITRSIDEADRVAGLRTLDFKVRGDGTFAPAPAPDVTSPDGSIVQYVRVDVEDGLQMSEPPLAAFVMTALNDPQGWGQEGPTTYVQTEGAPDIRIVFATPYTAAELCPTPHEPASLAPSASPSPSSSEGMVVVQCAAQGAIVVSIYDWIQGFKPFGEDRTSARVYLLNHGLGHVNGKPDVRCRKGTADVMVNQTSLPKKCTANPWPFPAKK